MGQVTLTHRPPGGTDLLYIPLKLFLSGDSGQKIGKRTVCLPLGVSLDFPTASTKRQRWYNYDRLASYLHTELVHFPQREVTPVQTASCRLNTEQILSPYYNVTFSVVPVLWSG